MERGDRPIPRNPKRQNAKGKNKESEYAAPVKVTARKPTLVRHLGIHVSNDSLLGVSSVCVEGSGFGRGRPPARHSDPCCGGLVIRALGSRAKWPVRDPDGVNTLPLRSVRDEVRPLRDHVVMQTTSRARLATRIVPGFRGFTISGTPGENNMMGRGCYYGFWGVLKPQDLVRGGSEARIPSSSSRERQ